MKRKSPPSPTSDSAKGYEKQRPVEIVGALALSAKPKEPDSPREDADHDRKSSEPTTASAPPAGPSEPQTPSNDDFEKGIVMCDTCGKGIPFRDPQSGGFTPRLWDQHREQWYVVVTSFTIIHVVTRMLINWILSCYFSCSATCVHVDRPYRVLYFGLIRENSRPKNAPPPSEPIIFTPESTADLMSNPPHKKRRAKRTEEERIEYLRTDPYVAQYEPYRVLCASCNKWIRLRPNSTYCSIPWDAHRKSCLSKKA